jgi:hypothetical protein
MYRNQHGSETCNMTTHRTNTSKTTVFLVYLTTLSATQVTVYTVSNMGGNMCDLIRGTTTIFSWIE